MQSLHDVLKLMFPNNYNREHNNKENLPSCFTKRLIGTFNDVR